MAESSAPDPRRVPSIAAPADVQADPSRDLGGALHEVSNALTVVIGWIDRARAEGGGPELARALDVASARASQARSIVRRAIGAQEQPEPAGRIGLVIGDTLTGLDPELRRANIHAEQRIAESVATRSIENATTVLQILTNLLLNAVAMAPEGSTVRVDASLGPAGTVIFGVTDQGPGVPPERRETLFSSNITTRAGGAGIGLRHAAALARANGGALALGDVGRGKRGARFELTWPLRSSPTTPLPPPPESGPQLQDGARQDDPMTTSALLRAMPLAGTRILLVEDDDAVVDLLDTALTARGADVVSVRHRRDLPAALATGPFDAALFDISPIRDDVRGAVELVRSARPDADAMRVVLISGSAAHMPEMPDAWVAAWVRKPFEVAEILQVIAPGLGRR